LNTNQKAIVKFEQNEYEEAWNSFNKQFMNPETYNP